MLEVCRHTDFSEEALDTHDRGQFGVEDLQRHAAIVLQIAREVDGRHPARANLAFDGVAIGERPDELFSQLWHGANVMLPR